MVIRCATVATFMAILSPQVGLADEISSDFEVQINDDHPIDGIWRRDKFVPGAFETQDRYVRSGKKAAKLTVRTGQIERTGKGGEPTERAELQLDKPWWTNEGESQSYEFSIFFPENFPVDAKRIVVAQWKQICPTDSCGVDNPILSVRVREDRLSIVKVGDSGESEELYRIKGLTKNVLGKWLDFRFKVKFTREKDGLIVASINGQKVVDFSGVTAYSQASGYSGHSRFDFRMGLYRDRESRPLSLYFDRFKRVSP